MCVYLIVFLVGWFWMMKIRVGFDQSSVCKCSSVPSQGSGAPFYNHHWEGVSSLRKRCASSVLVMEGGGLVVVIEAQLCCWIGVPIPFITCIIYSRDSFLLFGKQTIEVPVRCQWLQSCSVGKHIFELSNWKSSCYHLVIDILNNYRTSSVFNKSGSTWKYDPLLDENLIARKSIHYRLGNIWQFEKTFF